MYVYYAHIMYIRNLQAYLVVKSRVPTVISGRRSCWHVSADLRILGVPTGSPAFTSSLPRAKHLVCTGAYRWYVDALYICFAGVVPILDSELDVLSLLVVVYRGVRGAGK